MTDYSGAYDYNEDPKHMVFTLARYKWVAKMLSGKNKVLEIGCGDGWKSRIVRQSVRGLVAVDGDEKLIAQALENWSDRWPIEFICKDALDSGFAGFDAVYCLDLLEHIPQEKEWDFLFRLRCAAPVCIIGTPSKESQVFASARSKAHHINCKRGEELRELCKQHWREVFMFTQNDEVVGTSHFGMAHYLFALCIA